MFSIYMDSYILNLYVIIICNIPVWDDIVLYLSYTPNLCNLGTRKNGDSTDIYTLESSVS